MLHTHWLIVVAYSHSSSTALSNAREAGHPVQILVFRGKTKLWFHKLTVETR
uniref:Uncharacterized protein n=1 Tax=Arundo donax TaxID=35708 RepID=A0A0A9BUV5_ARUDO